MSGEMRLEFGVVTSFRPDANDRTKGAAVLRRVLAASRTSPWRRSLCPCFQRRRKPSSSVLIGYVSLPQAVRFMQGRLLTAEVRIRGLHRTNGRVCHGVAFSHGLRRDVYDRTRVS